LDEAWIVSRIEKAYQLRLAAMRDEPMIDAIRLVNSEGDGLSGLIVDRFGDYLVIQVTALAMQLWLDAIVQWYQDKLQPQGILLRMDARTAANEGMEEASQVLAGHEPEHPVEIMENGVRIRLDLMGGQKTGYYLDQRANRTRAARWTGDGPMLDVCSYLGGFALAAARWAKPTSITAIDSSARALEHARENAVLNGCTNIEFVQGDAFDALDALGKQERRFQTVVLDPPRMASNRHQVTAALRAYHRLNLAALNLLTPGGVLITCSCSGRISRQDFIGMLGSVAVRARRSLQVVESLGADFDHPIDTNCPEGEYLKCMICRAG
jgi:23S rRNA (cytosine1962-C5)-methyltransferase